MKNYYQILNVKPTATDADIKRSYRILAKRYHPDVNPGDAAAADKFADINEANSVLSDPKQRAEYDAKLKEASSGINPEDVIARQRAQAQAAARQAAQQAQQAAFRGASMNNVNASAKRDATIARARQQAARQAQAQYQNAQAQAQMQAQVQALRNQAFQSGREQGIAEAKAAADAEIARLNTNLKNALAENKKLKRTVDGRGDIKSRLDDTERDRRELETELFNRDRELSEEKNRYKALEEQLNEQLNEYRCAAMASADALKKMTAENKQLRTTLEKAQLGIKKYEQDKKHNEQERKRLEQELNQAELKNKTQIQLQHDKRKQLQDEIDELTRRLNTANSELEILRAENDQWQQYAKSEEFISDTERRLEEWNKKTQADRRKAKPTLYGVLGVLIWATDEEIESAYAKLAKRYVGKSNEEIITKFARVQEAYAVLSDPQKRVEYNASIGVTEAMIKEERKLIAENESLMEEYRSRLAGKEFWAHYDELTASALEGDAQSQNSLGEMLYYGDEIERDLEQAVYWFKEAAKQKHADAMYNLGICFINGEGVERNEQTGQGFVRQAVKLGSKAAKQYTMAQKAAAAQKATEPKAPPTTPKASAAKSKAAQQE